MIQRGSQLRVTTNTTSILMTRIRLAIVLALLPTLALAQTRSYRDNMAREVGRSTTSPNGTTFYDALGRTTGRSITTNGTTTVYDASGREVGRVTKGR
jgi:YD repeat-containing protein